MLGLIQRLRVVAAVVASRLRDLERACHGLTREVDGAAHTSGASRRGDCPPGRPPPASAPPAPASPAAGTDRAPRRRTARCRPRGRVRTPRRRGPPGAAPRSDARAEAQARLVNSEIERGRLDRRAGRRHLLVGRSVAHADHLVGPRLPLVDLDGVDANPAQAQAIDLHERPEPQPGHEPPGEVGVVDAGGRIRRPGVDVGRCTSFDAANR